MLDEDGKELILPVSENRKALHQLMEKVDDLCAFYLTLDDEGRDRVRKLVSGYKSLRWGLLGHISGVTMYMSSGKDVDWFRRGLAAASILDCQEDFRDIWRSLGTLYLAGTRFGIDASFWFKKIGELSSTAANPFIFNESTRDFLLAFEQSAYFKASVANEAERVRRDL